MQDELEKEKVSEVSASLSPPLKEDVSIAVDATQNPPSENTAAEVSLLDPTRYGDWIKNGRAIDF